MKYVIPGLAALLAVLAVLAVLVPVTPAGGPQDLTVIRLNDMDCGPEGTAKSDPRKALNRLKNRFNLPKDDDIDPLVSLQAMLALGPDRDRFSPKKAATIQGLVVKVSFGGIEFGETCNCESKKKNEVDTHIDLAMHPDAPPKQHVIVEITQRLRLLKKMQDPTVDWSTEKVKEQFEGRWVEVTGWLMFDTEHVKQAENTNPGNPQNFRGTCWELHPVTSIKRLDAAPDEAAGFQHRSFTALQRTHAAQVRGSKTGMTALAKLHEQALKGFSDEERKEIEKEGKAEAEKRLKKP
jgi:hypothetical protein